MSYFKTFIRVVSIGALMMAAGCTAQFKNHGYIPPQSALSEVITGVDTRESVRTQFGPPSLEGFQGDGHYYYVQDRIKHFAFYKPQIVERELLAISFDQQGVVRNIERFGLEDGQVITLSRRVTKDPSRRAGVIAQIFKTLGQFSPANL